MLWKVGHIMYRINSEQFSQTLLQFIGCVLTKQNNEHYRYSTKISFDSGFLRETEGYKRDVWGQAQNILQANSWSKSNLWKYNIAQRLLSCINIKTDSGEKQNLLNWHDIEYFKDVLSWHPKKVEAVIYQIYCSNEDERSFNDAISLFGNRYPLISFFFFLKKGSNHETPYYLPVRPQAMSEQFQKLGIQTDCLSNGCTWEHYQEYLYILRDVQNRLNQQLGSTVDLLDAHSFVWSMWVLDEVNISELPQQFYTLEKDLGAIQGDTCEAVIKVRVNQSVFRERLLNRYHKCCLCGVCNPTLLVASHIKPWADSNPLEKLDVDNGFLFCPNHDRLFDKGLISFEDSGKVIISRELSFYDRLFTNIADDMKIHLTEGNQAYLSYHREHVFKQ